MVVIRQGIVPTQKSREGMAIIALLSWSSVVGSAGWGGRGSGVEPPSSSPSPVKSMVATSSRIEFIQLSKSASELESSFQRLDLHTWYIYRHW